MLSNNGIIKTPNITSGALNISGGGIISKNINIGIDKYDIITIDGTSKWNNLLNSTNKCISITTGSNGNIIAGYDGGKIFNMSYTEGTKLWENQLDINNIVCLCTGDNIIYSSFIDGKIYAINLLNGIEIWNNLLIPSDYCRCISVGLDDTLFAGYNTGILHAINSTGISLWNVEVSSTYGISSIKVGLNGSLYIGLTNGYIYNLSPIDGSEIWSKLTYNTTSCNSITNGIDGNIFLIFNDGVIYSLNYGNGTEIWHTELTIGENGLSINTGLDGTIYISYNTGKIYSINPLNYNINWNNQLEISSNNSITIGIDGNIYSGFSNGVIHSINTNYYQGKINTGLINVNEIKSNNIIGNKIISNRIYSSYIECSNIPINSNDVVRLEDINYTDIYKAFFYNDNESPSIPIYTMSDFIIQKNGNNINIQFMGDDNIITSIEGTTKFNCALIKNDIITPLPAIFKPYNGTLKFIISCVEVDDGDDFKVFTCLTYDNINNIFIIEPWNITTITTGTQIKILDFNITYVTE
jgi:outer membrane protein assembly factor BamB